MNIQTGASMISNKVVELIIKRLGLPKMPDDEKGFCEYWEKTFTFKVTGEQLAEILGDVEETMFSFIKNHPELYDNGEEMEVSK